MEVCGHLPVRLTCHSLLLSLLGTLIRLALPLSHHTLENYDTHLGASLLGLSLTLCCLWWNTWGGLLSPLGKASQASISLCL